MPGIPGAELPAKSPSSAAAEALTDHLLRAKAIATADDLSGSSDGTAATAVMKEAREKFDLAVKLAGQNAELVKRQTQVPERISDATEYLNQCASEFAEAKAKRALDEEAFDDALIGLRESMESLARQAGRTFTSPGEGVAWLLDSVRSK